MSADNPQPPLRRQARYDLLAVNLTLAVISALLMAAVGGSVKVVQLLEKTEIAGIEVNLAVGAAVNPGVLFAAATIFFAMAAAICCTWRNRLSNGEFTARLVSFMSWAATVLASLFFIATLILAPLSLAVQVGI